MSTKLHRGSIVRAAREVARRKGIDAVTIRAVAGSLGVSPMGLYRHIESSEELRHAALDAALMQVPWPASDGSVRDRLWGWSVETRRVLRRYPGLVAVCLTDWPELHEGCRMMESLLTVAAVHTDNPHEQVAIANAVFVYVLTRVIAERAVLARGKERKLPAVEAEPRRFPRLVKVQSQFRTIDTDRHFGIGLDALLDGLLGSIGDVECP